MSRSDARQTLAEDDQRMVEDGLLLDDAEPFDLLLQRCQALALKVNAAALGPHDALPAHPRAPADGRL